MQPESAITMKRPGHRPAIPPMLSVVAAVFAPMASALASASDPPDITVEVVDVNVGAAHGNPSDPVAVNGELFFSAKDGFDCSPLPDGPADELGEYGNELFRAGIGTGPILVKDINDSTSGNCSGVNRLDGAVSGGLLVFLARDDPFASGSFGGEPWQTSGSKTSTKLLKDIRLGTDGSWPSAFASVLGGTRVAFTADHPVSGREPWLTDGSETGTRLLKDLMDGDGDSNANQFTPLDASRFVFVAEQTAAVGRELFVSDGVGASLVKDVDPGSFNDSDIDDLTTFDGRSKVVFSADDGSTGNEPWVSDGTLDGTKRLADINPGIGSSNPVFTQVGDRMFFAADDNGEAGSELWVTDGTPGGTRLVADVNPGAGNGFLGHGASFNGVLHFGGWNGALWTSDGTPSGTKVLVDGFAGGGPGGFAAVGDLLYFAVNTFLGNVELWVTDGTAAGTVLVDDTLEKLRALTPVNENVLAFVGRRPDSGEEIFLAYDADKTPPIVSGVSIAPDSVLVREVAVLDATASDATTGNSRIAIIEYRIDSGDWQSVPTPADGLYDEETEAIQVDLSFDTAGTHAVCVRARDDKNNLSEPTCADVQVDEPDPRVRIRAIEVNQAIQNWRNSIPLYHDKPTVVRVFVERTGPSSPQRGRGLLHGSVDGRALPGSPLEPEQLNAPVADDATAIDFASTEVIEGARPRVDGSLNFVLPASWTNPTTEPVVLAFESTFPSPAFVACAEPDGAPDCAVELAFADAPRPQLSMVAVPYNRQEIRTLEVTATGGAYRFSSEGRLSGTVAFDEGIEAIDDAVEDVLNARNGRVRVLCLANCDDAGSNARYRIAIMRGQEEELTVIDDGLTGSVDGSGPSATLTRVQAGGPEIRPSDAQLVEQARRISDNFPISSIDRRLIDINGFNRAPTVIKVNTRLQRTRDLGVIFGSYRRTEKSFGYMIGGQWPESTRSGQAWVKVASAYSAGEEEPQSGGQFRNLSAHESAHTYGRAHAVTRRVAGVGSVGVCGAKGHIHLPVLHPWIEETRWTNAGTTDFYSDISWPTIGPLSDGPDNEIWGFSPRAYLNGTQFDHLVVIDPWRTATLMSYCDGVGDRQDTWVSALTYDILASRIHGSPSRAGGSARGTAEPQEFVLVAGEIDPATGEADFDPLYRAFGADPGFDAGAVQVALVDDSGSELSARDVALLEDGNDESLSYGSGPIVPAFLAAVPVPDGAVPAGVKVSMGGEIIGELSSSPNPPTVSLESPFGGETHTNTIPISWAAHDLDGDALATTVLYSADGGITWQPLAVDHPGSSYEAPARFLRGSTQAMIRVQVSDGFHIAQDTSGLFDLDAGGPRAIISLPAAERTSACNVLRLRSDSWDPEEGELEGSSLTWVSDLDGSLGTGREVWIDTSAMKKGTHRITLRATDDDGRTGTDEVRITLLSAGCEDAMFINGFE